MNPTYINPNANYFNPMGTLDTTPLPGMQAPIVPTTVNAATLGTPVPNLQLGSFQQPVPYDIQAIPTIDQVQQQANNAVNIPVTPAETAMGKTRDAIMNTLNKLSGRSSAQLQQEQKVGLPGFQNQLTDINSQIQTLQKENAAIPLQLQQDVAGRGITAGGLQPIQTAALRNNSIKALGLSAIAQTLQGNIAQAQATADRAIEVEFAPAEAELNFLKQQYDFNQQDLTREDKKRSESLQIMLGERERLLTNQKEDKKITYGWAAEAAKNGAPSLLINQAMQQGDPEKALGILAQYMSDPEAKANALMQRKVQQAQIDTAYANISLNKQELALKTRELALKEAKDPKTGDPIIDPVTGKATSQLKVDARNSAATLLQKMTDGKGTSAVGMSRVFGLQYIPGTNASDFKVQVDNLKSLLSLDNVKLLKGQGAVSDSERALLSAASANLSLSQSDSEFKSNLIKISIGLGNPQTVTLTDKNGKSQQVTVNADTLNQAQADGLTVKY